jgi:uncharacterized protein
MKILDKHCIFIGLLSYVATYFEQEIRSEAVVRNIGSFSHFLQVVAGESGNSLILPVYHKISGLLQQQLPIIITIEDCLSILRIDPTIDGQTKRRLIKSPKYLFFDLGIRRACANEGTDLQPRVMAELFTDNMSAMN